MWFFIPFILNRVSVEMLVDFLLLSMISCFPGVLILLKVCDVKEMQNQEHNSSCNTRRKCFVTCLRVLKGQVLNSTDLSLIFLHTLLSWHFLNSILETTCFPHPWLVVCLLCCQLDHPLEKEKDQSGSAVLHLLILINDIV